MSDDVRSVRHEIGDSLSVYQGDVVVRARDLPPEGTWYPMRGERFLRNNKVIQSVALTLPYKASDGWRLICEDERNAAVGRSAVLLSVCSPLPKPQRWRVRVPKDAAFAHHNGLELEGTGTPPTVEILDE